MSTTDIYKIKKMVIFVIMNQFPIRGVVLCIFGHLYQKNTIQMIPYSPIMKRYMTYTIITTHK